MFPLVACLAMDLTNLITILFAESFYPKRLWASTFEAFTFETLGNLVSKFKALKDNGNIKTGYNGFAIRRG